MRSQTSLGSQRAHSESPSALKLRASPFPSMSPVNFNSVWVRSYANVKPESDPLSLTFYLKAALDATTRLSHQGLEDDERKAVLATVRDLYDMSKQSHLLNRAA